MSLGRILGSQNGSGARAAALWGHGGLGAWWAGGTVGWGHGGLGAPALSPAQQQQCQPPRGARRAVGKGLWACLRHRPSRARLVEGRLGRAGGSRVGAVCMGIASRCVCSPRLAGRESCDAPIIKSLWWSEG